MTKAELVRALAAYPDDAWVYVNCTDKRHDGFYPAGVRLLIQGVRPRAVNDSAVPHLGLLVDADNRERAAEAGDAWPACGCGTTAAEHQSPWLLSMHHLWYLHPKPLPGCQHCEAVARANPEMTAAIIIEGRP